MTSTFPLAPYRDGISTVAASVYETMLGVTLHPVAGDLPYVSGAFMGAVYYAGAWKGALLLECSAEQAMPWGARLMSLEPPSTSMMRAMAWAN